VLYTLENWLCVMDNMKLKRKILDETHMSRYTIDPGENMMGLKKLFWWTRMQCEKYVSVCLTCQSKSAKML
jgi:hypothetical protein